MLVTILKPSTHNQGGGEPKEFNFVSGVAVIESFYTFRLEAHEVMACTL